jgi:hypothetical protein
MRRQPEIRPQSGHAAAHFNTGVIVLSVFGLPHPVSSGDRTAPGCCQDVSSVKPLGNRVVRLEPVTEELGQHAALWRKGDVKNTG